MNRFPEIFHQLSGGIGAVSRMKLKRIAVGSAHTLGQVKRGSFHEPFTAVVAVKKWAYK
jgi:hypothetical protein